MKALLTRAAICIVSLFAVVSPALAQNKAKQLEALASKMVEQYGFNGSVLVMENGNVLLERNYGLADFRDEAPINDRSAFHLAQASEQFTAMAVLLLEEQGKISLSDDLSKYLPELHYSGLTLQHLLTHTSGLADYPTLLAIHWEDKHLAASNQELLEIYDNQQPPLNFRPGKRRERSGMNYVLLAMVVERVSGKQFEDFVEANIFAPLGMENSFVLGSKNADKEAGRVYGFRTFLVQEAKLNDQTYQAYIQGDKNVYSTVEDLRLWNAAIQNEKLINQSSIDAAFGLHTATVGKTVLEHSGEMNGFRIVIEQLGKGQFIVILNNTRNEFVFDFRDAVEAVLAGAEYKLPSIPVSRAVAGAISQKSVEEAVLLYERLKKNEMAYYNFRESELNELGHELLRAGRAREAIVIFMLNTQEYPNSFNVYDSLAEAYMAQGQRDKAIANYKRSLEIYPDNDNARIMLSRMGAN